MVLATLNVNKAFPRLSVRLKLAIAFAVIALAPLATVSLLGMRETIARIEETARETLRFDLELAERETARALAGATGHVVYLAERVLSNVLRPAAPDAPVPRDVARLASVLIETEPTLFQVKVIDPDGAYRLVLRARGTVVPPTPDGGQFYAVMADGVAPGEHAFIPVEVADVDSLGAPTLVRCIAILVPLHHPDGALAGVVVGEAYAAELFTPLDRASAGFQGTTGLVDDRGLVLFHSSQVRDAATPLAAQRRLRLADDVAPENTSRVLAGAIGNVLTDDDRLISFRPLALPGSDAPRLHLYRVLPISALTAPARRFLMSVLLAAPVVVLIVLALAMIAADQFTRPILRVREAAWRLARHEPLPAPVLGTNDEIEDLARDFWEVSRQVESDRAQLEALIAERTRLLDHTRTELSDLLANSADAIVLLDADGMVRTWNRGAVALFGWSSEEACGNRVDDLLFDAPLGDSGRAAELRRSGSIVNAVTSVHAKDGSAIPVSITQTRLTDPHGLELGSSLILRDHRERDRLEEHLRRSERLAAMSVMAAGLAHELNNPLAIIGNRIECMIRDAQRAGASPTVERDLATLQEHVTRLGGLTQSLLRFAREDDGAGEPVMLEAVVTGIASLLRQTFAMRGVSLTVTVAEPVPSVVADAKAMEAVLVNLLLNAADATPAGGQVDVTLRATAVAIEIEVQDTGPGIPVELRTRVFEPFFTTKGAGRGTGLGLAVCRSIIDRHGGTIHLSESPSGGCRFVVALPPSTAEAAWKRRAS